jgi:hypothetical protein
MLYIAQLFVLWITSITHIHHHLEKVMMHQGHPAHRSESGPRPSRSQVLLQSDRACPRLRLIVEQYGYRTGTNFCTAILPMKTYLSRTSRPLASLALVCVTSYVSSGPLVVIVVAFSLLLVLYYLFVLKSSWKKNILRCHRRTFSESRYVPRSPFPLPSLA